MSENPDKARGSLTEHGDRNRPERLLPHWGTTERPLPEKRLTEKALEEMKQIMRERSPSKVKVRKMEVAA